jgi:hypothetical protein
LTVIKKSRHGFKAFINAMRLFCCLFILLNAKGDTEVALKRREGSALRYRYLRFFGIPAIHMSENFIADCDQLQRDV